jgi:FkbM family methyltransferase
MIAPFKDPWVGSSLVGMGEYSPIECDFLSLLADKEKVSLDIGANIGATAIPLGQASSHVYAFEPVPFTFDLLRANVELTNANVTPLKWAAASHKCTFSTDGSEEDPDKDLGSVTLIFNQGDGHIQGHRLDSHVMPFAEQEIGLIKLDIEGAEAEALKGAKTIIEHDKPYVFFEALHEDEGNASIAAMHEYGYNMAWFITMIYCPENFKGLKENPWGMTSSFNIVAWHPSKHQPIFDELPSLDELKVGTGKATPSQIIGGLGMRNAS